MTPDLCAVIDEKPGKGLEPGADQRSYAVGESSSGSAVDLQSRPC